jgi:tRNA (guanine-N(7)-)-methyltransferase subunit TRM82
MLVDLIIADRDGSSYIISADRDEHIRVTGYPQSNIIERWLFGHRAFVSQLCLLSWSSQHLVSGGGDDCIFLWDWTTGKMIDQFNMRPVVQEYFTDLHKSPSSSSNYEITVSKIISLPNLRQILVLCEG